MVIARGFELQTRKYAVAVNQRLLIIPLKSDIYVDWRFETHVVLSFLMIAASNWIVYLDSENLGEQILRREQCFSRFWVLELLKYIRMGFKTYIYGNRDIREIPGFVPGPLDALVKEKVPFHLDLQRHLRLLFLQV